MSAAWPVWTRYDRHHLERIGLALVGIGTGSVSLWGVLVDSVTGGHGP